MCQYCAAGSPQPRMDHARVLHLLAMIEHPDALPAEAVLRIANELLAWVGPSQSRLRCEVVPPETPIDNVA
jgi:hypothetical protein